MNVTVARYALGVAATLAILGSLGFAATALRRRYLPEWREAQARLAEIVIGLVLLVGLLEVLGAVGLFQLWAIVTASVLVSILLWGTLGWARGESSGCATGFDASPSRRPLAVMAIIAAVAVTAEWAIPTLQSFDFGVRSFDSLWYHLPWAAAFAQTGHVTPLRFTDVEYLTAFYPATAELFHGLGITLLARDTLSPALNLVWLWLVLLAAYCVGRPRGVAPLTLTAAALAMATPMMRFSQPGSAANDVVGAFFLLAAVALLLNARESRFALGLAGASAGVAVGTKLSMVAPALALTIGVLLLAPRRRRLAWFIPFVLASGFWYLRNLIAVGNPLPWLNIPGLHHPAAPLQQHTGFAVSHYLFNGHVVSKVFEPGLASGLGPWWAVTLIVAVLGPVLCLLPSAGGVARMLGLVALVSAVAYLVTPESAAGPAGTALGFAFNLRYAAPALALCLVVAPLAPVFSDQRVRLALLALLAIVLIATFTAPHLWASGRVAGAIVLAVAMAVAATATRWRPVPALAVAIVIVAAGGYVVQRHYMRVRYAYQPGISSLTRVWAYFRRIHHARVGIVGTFGGFFSYPLAGLDDSNQVIYVARRGPHGSFTPIVSCTAWRSAVNAQRLRYLVTTPGRDPWHPAVLLSSPEYGWTATDPAARLAYRYHALGQPIAVFALRGALDPPRCRG